VRESAEQHAGAGRYSMHVAAFVADGLEAHIGVARDPEWGAAVSVGIGGREIELIRDSALLVPGASLAEARAAVERTRFADLYRARWPEGHGLDLLAEVAADVAALLEARDDI